MGRLPLTQNRLESLGFRTTDLESVIRSGRGTPRMHLVRIDPISIRMRFDPIQNRLPELRILLRQTAIDRGIARSGHVHDERCKVGR